MDIDNTVIDLNEGVRLVLLDKGIRFYPELIDSYDYGGNIGCDSKYIYECFRNPETYRRAPLFYGVEESLQILKRYTDVYAWSLITQDDEIVKIRMELCERLGLKPLLYKYPNEKKRVDEGVAAVFEDSVANLEMWRYTPTDLYLITQSYNRRCTDRRFMRVYNLAEGVNRFINRLHIK